MISGLENKYLADGSFADGYIGGAVSGVISGGMRATGRGDFFGTLSGSYLTNVLNGDTSADTLGKSLEPAVWSAFSNVVIDSRIKKVVNILPNDIYGKASRGFLKYVNTSIDLTGGIISENYYCRISFVVHITIIYI